MDLMNLISSRVIGLLDDSKGSMVAFIDRLSFVSDIEEEIDVIVALGAVKELESVRFTNFIFGDIDSISTVDFHVNKVVWLSLTLGYDCLASLASCVVVATDPIDGFCLQNFSIMSNFLGVLAKSVIVFIILLLEDSSSRSVRASRSVAKLQLVVVEHNWLNMLFFLILYLNLKTKGISCKLAFKDGNIHIGLFICCCHLLNP